MKKTEKYMVIKLYGTGTTDPEIVEMSCYVIDGVRLEIEDHQFHAYVKPSEMNKQIEEYITKIGIRPYAVKQATKRFPEVLFEFNTWLEERKITNGPHSVTVTEWGKPFGEIITAQCKRSEMQIPWWGTQWYCLRKEFKELFSLADLAPERVDLSKMISVTQIPYEGKKDSSWDQAFNFAAVCAHILRKGAEFKHKEGVEDLLL